ncbi:MAG: T9SS type A sorting domain-containing protein [candidate division KSB1 bacterium]|nr:T9SS type A sorting domain-containing protein [candidate division KSB1 bacterium]MDZ7364767.1 T9SS type A sorting domain-containing protein [candidate division KSB1 bacterium]MDZ7402485.1 T9SS type A sorting domain-containing protein [candidate division KSB1 bacterium]
MPRKFFAALPAALIFSLSNPATAQHSVARQWNEVLLEAIRHDFARPTVHARNLFHASLAMYDAWAAFDQTAETCFLGKSFGGFHCAFTGISTPANVQAARNEAISHAAYRLLTHRFRKSPGAAASLARFDSLLTKLGYNPANTSTDYSTGSAAALGNYIGQRLIEFGLQDGANEQNDYTNLYYKPINPPLITIFPGNPKLVDPNRWQPLTLEVFIDQAGNVIPGDTPPFLSPEWGRITPFALKESDRNVYTRDGKEYWVYHDPGPPDYIHQTDMGTMSEEYKWGFTLVAIWSSHLDPTDGVMWDISPAAIGNIQHFPMTSKEFPSFYKLFQGGDIGRGRVINPRTGLPYQPQIVPRGDYTRTLAEFWADGPHSETPPGHWFTILNYVSDHPAFQKRFRGQGPILEALEWDVKAYLALGGAVHDAAITAWGIKGWYDYIRPISVIRWMAERTAGTNPNPPGYPTASFTIIPNFIEIVQPGDTLAGENGKNLGKVKLRAWRGPAYIKDPQTDVAGVGWILAENWWPYQRPTFVTPPFAGYISGHSTFSRAAAEVMTLLTGDEYFPGGMGEFHARKNEYLVFEDGPSVDLTLQWATYRDASDQCSLSRIWGGIHPPVDDIPGRLIGRQIGINAFLQAERYFTGQLTGVKTAPPARAPETFSMRVYPNPIQSGQVLTAAVNRPVSNVVLQLYDLHGRLVQTQSSRADARQYFELKTNALASGIYLLQMSGANGKLMQRVLVIK